MALNLLFPAAGYGQVSGCPSLTNVQAEESVSEHLFGGNPGEREPIVRRGFVLSYDDARLVPAWAAWRAAPEYRNTPPREGRWKTFRADPATSPVRDRDYVGWYDAPENFARGHIVPYFIAGGDRNHDGRFAAVPGSTQIDDMDDACTVYEINSMPNIAPQYHALFNGAPGVWYKLETDIRHLVDNGRSFQIIAGTVFTDSDVSFIGNREHEKSEWAIAVPHGFFKIVVDAAGLAAVGFLFDHETEVPGGCPLLEVTWPSECIVPISRIEEVTGLRFFADLTEEEERLVRAASHGDTWLRWVRALQ